MVEAMRRLRRPDPAAEARWLAQVRETATAVLAPYPVDLFLFGSRARGEARLASDIDLALDPHGELPQSVLAELEEKLDETTVPVRVEVVDLRQVSAAFRSKVLDEGVQWIACKSA
jgi:hypothetical protein